MNTALYGANLRAAIVESPGRVNLRTLVNIRWIAVAGQLVTLLVVHFGMGFHLPILPALAVVGASAVLNVVVTLTRPLNSRLGDRAAALYLAYDMLQLFGLLFLTGGLQNPFSLLILAPVTVSSTVLSRGNTVGLGLLCGLCITILALWHLPFPWTAEGFRMPDLYTMGLWEALCMGTLFIAVYVGSVSEEARKMSDALAATQMALAREQRLSELGAQAAAAAHELGSPLATIAVVAKEMAREVPDDSALTSDIELLISQSDRCRDILAQMGRRPAADAGAPYTLLPLPSLVEEASYPYDDGRIDLSFHAEPAAATPGEPPPIVRRSPEIVHGVGNIVQNAVQFARQRVGVRIEWSAETATVTVRDDGAGFPGNVLDRIGEPYLSTRGGEGHMGLGVFIARTLLERTGARLTFANAADTGAVVTIAWPRSAIDTSYDGAEHERDAGK